MYLSGDGQQPRQVGGPGTERLLDQRGLPSTRTEEAIQRMSDLVERLLVQRLRDADYRSFGQVDALLREAAVRIEELEQSRRDVQTVFKESITEDLNRIRDLESLLMGALGFLEGQPYTERWVEAAKLALGRANAQEGGLDGR